MGGEMKPRAVNDRVAWVGAVDWDRRLFDSLIPLPDGTSYNSYLVKGAEKTALLDSVDPSKRAFLLENLEGAGKVDYIVSHHTEQDHSGLIPELLARYPGAKLLATPRAAAMLADHLGIPAARVTGVADGETVSLGDRTLKFVHIPWVHWPETMATFLVEDRILFPCDLFGSHLATTDLYARDERRVYESAKRYYAEIMMPFAKHVAENMEKVAALYPAVIAPSHGPLYDRPAFIMDAYREWVLAPPRNMVLLAYVSMHGSTLAMVDRLTAALAARGVSVERFDLVTADLGRVAETLVDAATVVVGTPTVLGGPHPSAINAAALVGALKGKAQWISVIGSLGWGGRTVETLAGLLQGLKAEIIPPVLAKGLPKEADLAALDALADAVSAKHKEANLK
jgi:flavorubredoxin